MRCLTICSLIITVLAVIIGASIPYLTHYNKFTRGMSPIFLHERHFTHNDIPDLTGQVIIVTGSNTGLGLSTSKYLALNNATVIMACRDLAKCDSAKQLILKQLSAELKQQSSSSSKKLSSNEIRQKLASVDTSLQTFALDLSSLASVKAFANNFMKKFSSLNSLILNAGVMHIPFTLTSDKLETQFGVNHIAHFYLTKLLLPLLEKAQKATVVSVSSNGHFAPYEEGIKLDIHKLNSEEEYDRIKAYGQSKLANVLFANELAKRVKSKGIFVNSLNPGAVKTDLTRHYPDFLKEEIMFVLYHLGLFYLPDEACITQIYCSIAPEIFDKQISGEYFVPLADKAEMSEMAKNETLAKKLWELSEKILAEKGFS